MHSTAEDELKLRFVGSILKIISVIGFVAYVPSMYLSLTEHIWVIAVVDTAAYLAVLLITFIKKISVTLKMFVLIVLAYTLGVGLLIFTGPFGAGIIYLFAFIFLTALLYSARVTLFANIFVVLTFVLFGLLNSLGFLSWEQGIESMLVIVANFVLVAFILSYGISFLMGKLQDHIKSQTDLHAQLKIEIRHKEFERTRAEKALEEQRQISAELHHRVKNNLQVLSSLINLHDRRSGEQAEGFRGLKERIRAISMIHLLLYATDDVASLELSKTLNFILDNLIIPMAGKNIRFNKKIDVNGIDITADRATLLSLILNEILTNAARHAFPDGRDGEIDITVMTDGDKIRFSIRDNGVGFDKNDVKQRLGFEILHTLLRQLKADYLLETHNGTQFDILIPADVKKSG